MFDMDRIRALQVEWTWCGEDSCLEQGLKEGD